MDKNALTLWTKKRACQNLRDVPGTVRFFASGQSEKSVLTNRSHLVWHRRRCFEEPTVLIPKRQEPREGSETLQGGHRPYGCDSGKVQKILMDRIGKLE